MIKGGMAEFWQRLHAFSDKRAPAMTSELRGPAASKDLAQLAALGPKPPPSLLASLRIHDGENDGSWGELLAGGGCLLSASAIVERYRMLGEALLGMDADDLYHPPPENRGIGPVRSRTHSPGWLPIIDLNGDVVWYIDFDPAPGGTPGQIIRVDLESGEWLVCANSHEEFWARYLDALETRRIRCKDGKPEAEHSWPPVEQVPWLAPSSLDLARLHALGAAERWDLAWKLLRKHLPATAAVDAARIEAHAHWQSGHWRKALRALQVLREAAAETSDDALLHCEILANHGKPAAQLAELGRAIQHFGDPRLYVMRAELWRRMSSEPPFEADTGAAMRWLASPPGQQHNATCVERAVSDYRAALATDARLAWQEALADCLLEATQWEAAETAYTALVRAIEAADADDSAKEHPLQRAREGLRRAQAQEVENVEDDLESLRDVLAGLDDNDLSRDLRAMLEQIGDTHADLLQREQAERAELEAEPDSTTRRAREVAEQLARMHADTPERFAPFDPGRLDAKARRYYDRAQRELEQLGYRHLGDVEPLRNTELNGNSVLMRVMGSEDAGACAAIWRLVGPFMTVEVIELESILADGRVLITNNTGASNPFDQPPDILIEALPLGTAAAKLESAHRARLQDAGADVSRIADLHAVLAVQEHQRMIKRDFARRRGWISDSELRAMLGGSYRELAPRVRELLAGLLP
jgi:cell wall assembly regulator SMI1